MTESPKNSPNYITYAIIGSVVIIAVIVVVFYINETKRMSSYDYRTFEQIASDSFNETSAAVMEGMVKESEEIIATLISEYTDLSEKDNLTEEEQSRSNELLVQISEEAKRLEQLKEAKELIEDR